MKTLVLLVAVASLSACHVYGSAEQAQNCADLCAGAKLPVSSWRPSPLDGPFGLCVCGNARRVLR